MVEMENRERLLVRFADQAEDAAAGLHRFRDGLPRSATQITTVVGELFAISSVLRQIHAQQGSRHYGSSFYRVHDDLALLFRTLGLTLDEIFGMFAQSQERQAQTIWEDLRDRMDRVERVRLLDRLGWYREFLEVQLDVLEGRDVEDPVDLGEDLRDLLRAQEKAQRRMRRASVSGASTPRPRRLSMHRLDHPISPTVFSDDWDNYTSVDRPPLVAVPEAPLMMSPMSPLSPTSTLTSSSSNTMSSSQTSYTGDLMFSRHPSPLVHWAQDIFDGSHPLNRYKGAMQLADLSKCYGSVDPSALLNLGRGEFQRVLQLAFDEAQLWVRLYWRVSDHRARILVMKTDSHGQPQHHCIPLTNLRIFRDRSSLQLCRIRRDLSFEPWARLNFFLHERMVLFYNTFVAMKRQDQQAVPHPDLIDVFALEDGEGGEQELFAGQIRHERMVHAVRLYRDRGSGVVRIEASPLRGSKRDVPIWTAFVTKYGYDPDWAHHEGNGVVSLAAIRPAPSVFITQYEPPKDRIGKFILPFTTDEDAVHFMESWANLCHSYGRRL